MFRKKKTPENSQEAGIKSTVSTTIPSKKKKFLIIGLASLVVLASLGTGGYVWYKRKQAAKKDKVPTIIFNGKEVPATYLTEEYHLQNPANLNPDRAKEAEDLEKKIISKGSTFDDHLALAQIYVELKQEERAIENYKKARQLADPQMEYYDSIIKSIDDSIKRLEEG